MNIKEVRKIKNLNKQKYVRMLQYRNKIKVYYGGGKGYTCYDVDEFKEYQKNCKVGRPPKEKGEVL